MTARIPPLLAPYLHLPPKDSLTLITGVLGASANWLILRYLYSALSDGRSTNSASPAGAALSEEGAYRREGRGEDEDVAVVLVSWMRDFEFWRGEAKRVGGLDLARLQQQGRFCFVDGLTKLFVPAVDQAASLPVRKSGSISQRGSVPSLRAPPSTVHSVDDIKMKDGVSATSGVSYLTNATLAHMTNTILASIAAVNSNTSTSPAKQARILLLLDHPNLLIHTTSPPISALSLSSAILTLRAHDNVHATVIALPADEPFVAPAATLVIRNEYGMNMNMSRDGGMDRGYEALDTENAALLVGLAQQAKYVLGCRTLGTGWADDVSGVVRATRGGESGEDDGEEKGGQGKKRLAGKEASGEGEWLYFVGGDGGVRVWGRGEGER